MIRIKGFTAKFASATLPVFSDSPARVVDLVLGSMAAIAAQLTLSDLAQDVFL
jgi:hypothetical protein